MPMPNNIAPYINPLVALCPGGPNLPAKFVIHVNGPSSSDTDAYGRLERCVKNCFTLAEVHNLKSIALPSIGSGRCDAPLLDPLLDNVTQAVAINIEHTTRKLSYL